MKEQRYFVVGEGDLPSLAQLLMQYIQEFQGQHMDEIWITQEAAEKMLGLKSSAMANLRYNGVIEFSQPSRKVILYKKESLLNYLEKHSKKPF